MKLKIKEMIFEAKLDWTKFKTDFKSTLDLEQSINKNIKIAPQKGVTVEMAQRLLNLWFDWGALLRNAKHVRNNEITFRTHMVELESFEQYTPLTISEDGSEYTLKKAPFNSGIIVIQDALPHPNFCIDNFFKNNVFVYNEKMKYKLEVKI